MFEIIEALEKLGQTLYSAIGYSQKKPIDLRVDTTTYDKLLTYFHNNKKQVRINWSPLSPNMLVIKTLFGTFIIHKEQSIVIQEKGEYNCCYTCDNGGSKCEKQPSEDSLDAFKYLCGNLPMSINQMKYEDGFTLGSPPNSIQVQKNCVSCLSGQEGGRCECPTLIEGEIHPNDYKANGLCPKCGHRGEFIAMALCCPTHGMFGGC